MKDETSKALKALLCFFYPQAYQEFYRFLAPSITTSLHIPFEEKIDLAHIFSEKRWMENIHYSWFLPFLEALPKEVQSLFLALFPKEAMQELKELLHVEKITFSPLSRFLLFQMYEKTYDKNVLPRHFLPSSDVNFLLDFSKKELTFLVDLLGIYDLAYEIRQIVDKTLLNKIYATLTKEELSFLNHVVKQSVKWIPPRLNLISWDGDAKKLQTLLHYRGLSRLAMAVCEEDKSYQWHLSRKFDIGRGGVLMKFFSGKYDPAMIPYFKGQVLDIIKRFPQ